VVAPAVATTGGASTGTSGVTAPSADTGMEERFRSAHTALDSRLAMLEALALGVAVISHRRRLGPPRL
jgi:hypothetical protein